MRRAAILILGLLLGACSSTGPLFVEAPPPPGGKALVYIYREPAMAFAIRGASFEVDGEDLAGLMQDGYTYFYLSAGRHEIKQSWPYWPGDIGTVGVDLTVAADVQPGRTYYRFTTGAGAVQNAPADRYEWALTPVSASQGRADLEDKHLVPADPKIANRL